MKFRLLFSSLVLGWVLGPLGSTNFAQTPPPAPPPIPSPAPGKPDPDPDPTPAKPVESEHRSIKLHLNTDHDRQGVVRNGSPVHIKTNEEVVSVVVMQSSARVDGKVKETVVVIGGDATINGEVGGDVVSVGGGVTLGSGARIGGSAVGILGGVRMATNSAVGGDAVGILSSVSRAEGAEVGGQVVNVALGDFNGPGSMGVPQWLETSFTQLVLKLRPLSFRVGWVWVAAGMFLLLHSLVLLAAPGAVKAVTTTLQERAATSFLLGLLALPLAAFLSLILVTIVVGIPVVPFLLAALFFAGLVGKAGLLQHLGTALGRSVQLRLVSFPALLLGSLLVSLLYLIPFLGLVFWLSFSLWALGAAILATFGSYRREAPVPATAPVAMPIPSPTPSVPPMTIPTPASATTGPSVVALQTRVEPVAPSVSAIAFAAPDPVPTSAPAVPSVPPAAPAAPAPLPPNPVRVEEASASASAPLPPPPQPLSAAPEIPEVLRLPRVGLRDRFIATLIDWALLLIALGWLIPWPRLRLLLFLGYFAGMWVWRQTTIGGIVMRLRVARLDERPIDPPTAIVRALGAAFGGVALGLGYFWAGWDSEKQGWHDKLAGTVVLKASKTQSLV